MTKEDTNWMIPEEIKQRLADAVANFSIEAGIEIEKITPFVEEIIGIYSDWMDIIDTELVN